MKINQVVISLPTRNRRMAYRFYCDALRLTPIGEPAEDGVPEPLQFEVNQGLRLMLIPPGGFAWVIGGKRVATPGTSECMLSIGAASTSEVDEIVQRAVKAGGSIVSEPAHEDWGYTGSFSDPDGHIWMVESLA